MRKCIFGFYGTVVSGAPIVCTLLYFMQPFVVLLGGDINTAADNRIYMNWAVVWWCDTNNFKMSSWDIWSGAEGASLHASIGTMSGCILNMILDPFFVSHGDWA